ncbi:MAG: DUF4397 domain-containing protein, partial [Anaerolineae bacterium]
TTMMFLALVATTIFPVYPLLRTTAAPEVPAAPVADARVRVAHASPDAPDVDVWVDGALALEDLAFEDISDYLTVMSGEHAIQVVPAGLTEPAVISATLTFNADMDYTIAATDVLTNITPVVLTDDNSAPADGMAHVRFVHFSPDAPAVDVALAGGAVLFGNISFQEESAYQPVSAGTYDLEVRLAGEATVVLPLPGVMFKAGRVYTVFAMGLAGGTPDLRAVTSIDSGFARVRVAHTSPDAPAVDVWVNGEKAFEGLAFEDISRYALLPDGAYGIQVTPAGQTEPAVISATLAFTPESDYTIAATDILTQITPIVLMDDNGAPAAGKAHVRFVHTSPNAPAVDVALAGGAVLFGNIAFQEASGYLPVDAGTYDLEVRLAGEATVVLPLPGVTFEEGRIYTVFATGFAGGDPALNALVAIDSGFARVRIAHTSPDAPAVDVWVDGAVAFADVDYKEVSAYAPLRDGDYFIQVTPAGLTAPVVISASLNLAPEVDYTVAAVGELANIAPLVLEDDNTMPATGKAHVRFIHTSPNAPAVDIALAGGPVLFSNIAFSEVGAYLPVNAYYYDLEVRLAGTQNVVLSLPRITLNEGTVYTIFAMGLAGGAPPLEAVLVADSGYARARVVHASPDAPNVDVWIDGALVPELTDVPFKAVSGYLPLTPGDHLIQVVPTGATEPVVISATLTFDIDKDYTIAATDVLTSITPIVFMDDNSAPADGKAHVRFIHLSPDAPAVNVYVNDELELFSNIAFQQAGPYQPVDADTGYDLYVRAAADTAILALLREDVSFRKESVYTIFAMGLLMGDPDLDAVVSLDKQYGVYRILMPLVLRNFSY